MAEIFDRVPPQNVEAEQSVLGAMLLDEEAIVKAMEILEPGDFYRDAHSVIFEAVVNLEDRSEAVDTITVTDELRDANALEDIGGVSYITELANTVPTAANVEYYAKIVEEKALLRQLIRTSNEINQRAYKGVDEVDELLDWAEHQMFAITAKRNVRSYAHLREILVETFEHVEKLHTERGSVIGIPSGYPDLDKMTSGFHNSELIILAARPAQGKTTLCLNFASHAAVEAGVPVAIFSLEMARIQLAQRMLCGQANIDAHRMRTGYLSEEDWSKFSSALSTLSEADIIVDDTPGLGLMELRARARRMKSEHNIGMIIIDYMQLMDVRGHQENRQQEIATISRSLKALARELDVPVIALSQLSRAVTQRQGQRPKLSDLRESGAIEQDADVVMFIYHNPDREYENVVELIVAKQRNGPTGEVKLVFLKDVGKFVSLDPKYYAADEG